MDGRCKRAGVRGGRVARATKIIPNLYRDSVSLMQLSAALARLDGIEQASAVIASPSNLALLREVGLIGEAAIAAGPNDLLIAVLGRDEPALTVANVVRRGDIGCVAASGTGLQQVTCLVDRLGAGISQAIGTGGHDLHRAVGGISMLQGLKALADDPGTKVIVLISKPPSPEV